MGRSWRRCKDIFSLPLRIQTNVLSETSFQIYVAFSSATFSLPRQWPKLYGTLPTSASPSSTLSFTPAP